MRVPWAVVTRLDDDRQPPAHEVIRNFIDLGPARCRQPRALAGFDDRCVHRVVDAGFEGGVQVRQPQHLG
jgi:hypothetical protein